MARLACRRGEPSVEVSEEDGASLASARLAWAPEGIDAEARLALYPIDPGSVGSARSPFVAAAVLDEERRLEALVELIDPLDLRLPRVGIRLTPWSGSGASAGHWGSAPVVLDPATHERAAEKIAAAAADAKSLLPAVMHLSSRLVEPEAAEVWLDRAVPPEQASPLLRYAAARRVAAAWRGDEPAARLWRERHAAMRLLVGDPRTQLLGRFAGL